MDILLILLIVIGAIVISYLLMLFIPQFAMFLIIAVLLGIYTISKFNIEYEYALTNGDLDIDMIISQKKRKRLLCKLQRI